jgi:membrane-bound lytic murein transglycosylase D
MMIFGKKILIAGLLLLLITSGAQAQEKTFDEGTERVSRDLDSLVNSWYIKMVLESTDRNYNAGVPIPQFSDSVYYDRLSRINSIITIPYNNIIRNHIHVYTERQADKFRVILGLQDYYFPMIEDIFGSYGLPSELKYMAVIESALNPNAVSKMGATGLWQFMYSTGRMYGLTMNSIVDERRDPVKSTHAAAKYLRDLYKIYNDWILVIAAYNCGPGNVNKAIARSGHKKDYWDIYYRLPRETRGYIPQYVAALYAMTYPMEHNLTPIAMSLPLSVDTLMITRDIHLSQIAEVMRVPYNELKALNPQYRTGLIPGKSKPSSLTLPMDRVGDFIYLSDTIVTYKSNVYLAAVSKTNNPASSAFTVPDIKGKSKLVYTVKSGDAIGLIAEWYKVPLSELRYWNNVRGNTIYAGQKLTVYVDPVKEAHFAQINSMTYADKQRLIGKGTSVSGNSSSSLSASSASVSSPSATGGEYEYYTVRSGDNVWDIAKKFDNVSATDILTLNRMTNNDKIHVGQKLKIRKK